MRILVRAKLVLGPDEIPFHIRCGVGDQHAASNIVAPYEGKEEEAYPDKGEAGPWPRRTTVSLKVRCR